MTVEQVRAILERHVLVEQATLFDIYAGEQIPAGKKSLAYAVACCAPDRTLTDKEVTRLRQRIVKQLEKEIGASIRSG